MAVLMKINMTRRMKNYLLMLVFNSKLCCIFQSEYGIFDYIQPPHFRMEKVN
jgi:hypothetical protein